MTEIDDLYQEVILDHYKTPRNFGVVNDANGAAAGHNPLCGDELGLMLRMEKNVIREIRFRGTGCAISTASASLMTMTVKDRTKAEALEMFERFHRMVTGEGDGGTDLGRLQAFAGVNRFPVRVKCATLAWHTLRAALEGSSETVTTE